MRTVELLEQAVSTAQDLGYLIRHEWLGGSSGGACEFGGRKWLFVDLALSPDEQLEQVCQVLRMDPGIYLVDISASLQRVLDAGRVA